MKRIPIVLAFMVTVPACTSPSAPTDDGRFMVVTTVSPITSIARNVAGEAARVEGIIPEGTDSHTFEPTPSSVRLIGRADLIVINGLHLEDPTLRLAEANKKDDARIVKLGDATVTADQYVYDFSFPKSDGKPNPHLWTDVAFGIRYAQIIRDELVKDDPARATAYRTNAATYIAKLEALDAAVATAIETIPVSHRVLLTYHDSFPYFARHYGMKVIGAIQPSDFSEPSARDVANLIDQIRREKVPAIFGSEVFPSTVLDQIARDTGARFESSLRDDDLPGEPGAPEHSYIGMMLYDVRTMVTALGGDPKALSAIDPASPYD